MVMNLLLVLSWTLMIFQVNSINPASKDYKNEIDNHTCPKKGNSSTAKNGTQTINLSEEDYAGKLGDRVD